MLDRKKKTTFSARAIPPDARDQERATAHSGIALPSMLDTRVLQLFGLCYPVLVLVADRPEEVRPKVLAVKNLFPCLPILRLHTTKGQHLIPIREDKARVATGQA